MHTQLYTNVTMNSSLKNGKGKTMPLEGCPSYMIPRDPKLQIIIQITHFQNITDNE